MMYAVVFHHDRAVMMELPEDPPLLQVKLAGIGIHESLNRLFIQENAEQPVRVKLFAESDRAHYAAGLFTAENTLDEANRCAHMLETMHEDVEDIVDEKLLRYKYSSPQELMEDIRSLTEDLAAITVDYYCPLKIHMTDEEYGDWYETDNGYAAANEDAVRALVQKEQARDLNDMTAYFNGSESAKAKLLSAVWDVQNVGGELYGVIHTKLTEAFSPAEEQEWIGELVGQAADGFGEGLEQRGIKTEDGEIYVSFWNDGDSYFMENETAFRQRLADSQQLENMHLGEM